VRTAVTCCVFGVFGVGFGCDLRFNETEFFFFSVVLFFLIYHGGEGGGRLRED